MKESMNKSVHIQYMVCFLCCFFWNLNKDSEYVGNKIVYISHLQDLGKTNFQGIKNIFVKLCCP